MNKVEFEEWKQNKNIYESYKNQQKFKADEWIVICKRTILYQGPLEHDGLKKASLTGSICYWTQVGHEDNVDEITGFEIVN